jgi:hypothetical protein
MGEMGSGRRIFDRLPLRVGDDAPLGARKRRRLIAEIIRRAAPCDNIGDHRNGRALMFFRSAWWVPKALADALLASSLARLEPQTIVKVGLIDSYTGFVRQAK